MFIAIWSTSLNEFESKHSDLMNSWSELYTGFRLFDRFVFDFRHIDIKWLVIIDNNNSWHLFATRCDMSDVSEVKLCRITQLVPLFCEL